MEPLFKLTLEDDGEWHKPEPSFTLMGVRQPPPRMVFPIGKPSIPNETCTTAAGATSAAALPAVGFNDALAAQCTQLRHSRKRPFSVLQVQSPAADELDIAGGVDGGLLSTAYGGSCSSDPKAEDGWGPLGGAASLTGGEEGAPTLGGKRRHPGDGCGASAWLADAAQPVHRRRLDEDDADDHHGARYDDVAGSAGFDSLMVWSDRPDFRAIMTKNSQHCSRSASSGLPATPAIAVSGADAVADALAVTAASTAADAAPALRKVATLLACLPTALVDDRKTGGGWFRIMAAVKALKLDKEDTKQLLHDMLRKRSLKYAEGLPRAYAWLAGQLSRVNVAKAPGFFKTVGGYARAACGADAGARAAVDTLLLAVQRALQPINFAVPRSEDVNAVLGRLVEMVPPAEWTDERACFKAIAALWPQEQTERVYALLQGAVGAAVRDAGGESEAAARVRVHDAVHYLQHPQRAANATRHYLTLACLLARVRTRSGGEDVVRQWREVSEMDEVLAPRLMELLKGMRKENINRAHVGAAAADASGDTRTLLELIGDSATVVLHSHLGSGKTRAIGELLLAVCGGGPQQVRGSWMWLVPRITLANSVCPVLEELGLRVDNYLDAGVEFDVGDSRHLVICMESLHKLRDEAGKVCDVLVMDESEGDLHNMGNMKTQRHRHANYAVLQALVRAAPLLILADAYPTDITLNVVLQLRKPATTVYIKNVAQPPRRTATEVTPAMRDDGKPVLHSAACEVMRRALAAVADGKNVAIACSVKGKDALGPGSAAWVKAQLDAQGYVDAAKAPAAGAGAGAPTYLFYSGKTPAAERARLAKVNALWAGVRILVFTSVISVGVSMDVPHFHEAFLFANSMGPSVATLIQMLRRTRALIDGRLTYCVAHAPWAAPDAVGSAAQQLQSERAAMNFRGVCDALSAPTATAAWQSPDDFVETNGWLCAAADAVSKAHFDVLLPACLAADNYTLAPSEEVPGDADADAAAAVPLAGWDDLPLLPRAPPRSRGDASEFETLCAGKWWFHAKLQHGQVWDSEVCADLLVGQLLDYRGRKGSRARRETERLAALHAQHFLPAQIRALQAQLGTAAGAAGGGCGSAAGAAGAAAGAGTRRLKADIRSLEMQLRRAEGQLRRAHAARHGDWALPPVSVEIVRAEAHEVQHNRLRRWFEAGADGGDEEDDALPEDPLNDDPSLPALSACLRALPSAAADVGGDDDWDTATAAETGELRAQIRSMVAAAEAAAASAAEAAAASAAEAAAAPSSDDDDDGFTRNRRGPARGRGKLPAAAAAAAAEEDDGEEAEDDGDEEDEAVHILEVDGDEATRARVAAHARANAECAAAFDQYGPAAPRKQQEWLKAMASEKLRTFTEVSAREAKGRYDGEQGKAPALALRFGRVQQLLAQAGLRNSGTAAAICAAQLEGALPWLQQHQAALYKDCGVRWPRKPGASAAVAARVDKEAGGGGGGDGAGGDEEVDGDEEAGSSGDGGAGAGAGAKAKKPRSPPRACIVAQRELNKFFALWTGGTIVSTKGARPSQGAAAKRPPYEYTFKYQPATVRVPAERACVALDPRALPKGLPKMRELPLWELLRAREPAAESAGGGAGAGH